MGIRTDEFEAYRPIVVGVADGELPKVWQWFINSPAMLNGSNCTEEQFVQWAKGQRRWGIKYGGELVGIVLFDAVDWPGAPKSDGFMTFALARKAWGKDLIPQISHHIFGELFESNPSLQRMTAYTRASNTLTKRLAEKLGSKLEGCIRMKDEDILIYGLTRGDFYGRS